ncbi:MAG: ABC transporter substrate-binding protein, partial [Bdellovibrio sp. CG22_combo_CG10-13_8_21_14_all_39_27]
MRFLLAILIIWGFTANAGEKVIITGSSTIAPVISDLAKIYEGKHSKVRIDVQTGGSSRGILDARKG